MRNTYLQLCDYGSRFRILKGGKIALVVSAFLTSSSLLYAAPSGGVITSGNANISQSGDITNITQSTQKASINWTNFNIKSNETVNFNQPNSSSITLNRVIGTERSLINGALNANGQVWILNSNGVLFNNSARINTSGLLATTKNLTDSNFQAGSYTFSGDSAASVINLGEINIANSGYASLLANSVSNEGVITAIKGKVTLSGADQATINLNGNSLVNLTINKGTLDALVENKGAIIADGGEIYLTTNAVDELLKGVVNNTGVLEAKSFDELTGKIELFAHGGTAIIDGTIKAEGGFVETSGKYFDFNGGIIKAGQWLIDPVNITIDAPLATAIQTALGTGDVTISTDAGNTPDTSSGESGSEGNININSEVSWAADNTFTLSAYNNINVNENITHTGTSAGGSIFLYGQGTSNGGTSAYSVASGKTVTSPSLQWRKGSDLASTRYANVDGNVFIGGKYIEIGIRPSQGVFGSANGTAIPSLFFGRQGGNPRIGMIGDADGFGVGEDLRIDYFLPGSDYENYRVFFDGTSASAYNSQFDSVNISLLELGADNTLRANVTSVEGDIEVVQNITFKSDSKYFQNSIVLTNNGATTMTDVAFAREFDPDNNSDVGGSSATIQKIESTIESDGYAVLSGKGQPDDPYDILAGSQSNILFYSADTRSELAVGSGCCSIVTTYGDIAFTKDYTVTGDKAMAIKFNVGSLAAGTSSSEIIYQTSLDNRDISSIVADLNINAGVSTPSTPPSTPSIITQIVNGDAVQPPVVILPQLLFSVPPIPAQQFSLAGSPVQLMSTPASDGTPTQMVSMQEIRQMKQSKSSNEFKTDIRIPLMQGSIIDLINGGVNLPDGIEQEFFMTKR